MIASGPFAGLQANAYKVLLIDPPWTYQTYSDKGKDRSAEQHYNCMSLEDMKMLPIPQIAAKDCVMFCWIIDTHLTHYLELVEAWGFKHKTKAFNWVKTNKVGEGYFTGMGHWTRANTEDCMLATQFESEYEDCLLSTKGHPKRVAKDVRRLVVAPRREHSRKPEQIYDSIERLVDGPYCELFARARRPGWTSWGNQVEKFNQIEKFSDNMFGDVL